MEATTPTRWKLQRRQDGNCNANEMEATTPTRWKLQRQQDGNCNGEEMEATMLTRWKLRVCDVNRHNQNGGMMNQGHGKVVYLHEQASPSNPYDPNDLSLKKVLKDTLSPDSMVLSALFPKSRDEMAADDECVSLLLKLYY
ncbi:hypothetical protein WN943_014492 [Citrus x changshan-huyou]